MKSRLFLSALLKARNIGMLIVMLGTTALLTNPLAGGGPVLPEIYGVYGNLAGFGIYAALVAQSLLSRKFHEEFNKKEQLRSIQNLNYTTKKLYNEVKRKTNHEYYKKLNKVIKDKNDIVSYYYRNRDNYLKSRIAEQTLNLVVSYLRLLDNYCIRSNEINSVNIKELSGRIDTNRRKIGFVRDEKTAEELKRIIDMDEKTIARVADEKRELERISAKLDYMESTVNMFKHQMLSSIETDEMLEILDKAVNEAEALETVLQDRRRKQKKKGSV